MGTKPLDIIKCNPCSFSPTLEGLSTGYCIGERKNPDPLAAGSPPCSSGGLSFGVLDAYCKAM